MATAFGIITSSANHIKIAGMQDYRPMGAFSFAGRYRVIDFPISNMSNSGIDNIQVYVRENPRSLAEHLGNEGSFNINSKKGKLQLLFSDNSTANDVYNTDIAAFAENMNIIARKGQEYVIIAPSYMVYTQDYNELLEQHVASGADITLLYHHVNNAKESYLHCDTLDLNKQKGVLSIERNTGTANAKNIFMDTYVMKKDLFISLVREAQKLSSIYTLSQYINSEVNDLDVRGVAHRGYFATVTDFKSYFEANLDLIDVDNANSLFHDNWPIYTVTSDAAPTKYYEQAEVRNSLVSNGCSIKGLVENSVIGRGVTIEDGAIVKNCVVLAYSRIGKDVHIENQVVDKWAQIIHAKEIIGTPEKPGYIKRDDIL
ncbi:MAG: glucose-1-phosphate adenylyltransferase subunit GlgD [Bilifractor sp.]|nr:glucose-1-phosphate adenylyltransferase subunit GlgD [Bilifractor sp.]